MVRNIIKRTSHEKKGYAKAYPFFVTLWGVEPQSKEPESFILSIELQGRLQSGAKIALFFGKMWLRCGRNQFNVLNLRELKSVDYVATHFAKRL